MNTTSKYWRLMLCSGLALGGWLNANPAANAQETNSTPTTAEDSTEYNNWITLGVGGTIVQGDDGRFVRQRQMPTGAIGGIEDLHLQQNVGKKGLFELDGHGIYDSDNYAVSLKLSEPDKGYVHVGFEQFRTWYDGSGGYYPGGTNNWKSLYDEELGVNRGKAWFEAGWTPADGPQITFRYQHEYRDGKKDSTIWGDASVVGTPGVYPTPTATSPTTRNFAPTFLDIDETRDTVALDLKHTVGKTDVGLGARYIHLDNDDSRNIHRRPGELTGANAAQTADRYVTEKEKLTEDMVNLHASTETRFTDDIRLTVGGSFTTMDTDIGGSRIYGNEYDPVLGNYLRSQQRDSGYFNLAGGANIKEYVGNVNFMFTPVKDLVIVPSLRIQKEYLDGYALYQPTTVNVAGGPVVTNALTRNTASHDLLDVAGAMEVRYAGFTNWTLYTRGEWAQATEDEDETAAGVPTSDEWNRFQQKYSVGANWYPRSGLNMGGQYYFKVSDNEWVDGADKDKRNFKTHDLNYRITWRVTPQVSLVTRYDFQISTVHNQGAGLQEVEGANMTSHIISESISWIPLNRLFVQLNGSYAWDGAMQTDAATQAGTTNVVPNLENGYWTGTLSLGYALDERTDLLVQYDYSRADNYVNNYLWSQPYGAEFETHAVTCTVSRQLNRHTRVSLKYGYFENTDTTSGGHNDYAAHQVFGTLQYRF